MKKSIVLLVFLFSFSLLIALLSLEVSGSLSGTVSSGTSVSFSCTASNNVNTIWIIYGTGSSRKVNNIATSTSGTKFGNGIVDLKNQGSHFVTCWGVTGTGINKQVNWLGETIINIGSSGGTTTTMGAIDLKILDQSNVPYTYNDNVRLSITASNWGPLNMRYNPSSSTGYMRISLESGKAYDIKMTMGTNTVTRKSPFIGTKTIEKVTYNLQRPSTTTTTNEVTLSRNSFNQIRTDCEQWSGSVAWVAQMSDNQNIVTMRIQALAACIKYPSCAGIVYNQDQQNAKTLLTQRAREHYGTTEYNRLLSYYGGGDYTTSSNHYKDASLSLCLNWIKP